MLQNVLNSIRAAAYAINPETYHVTFVNSYLRDLLPEMKRGALCYEALMARDTPCEMPIFISRKQWRYPLYGSIYPKVKKIFEN